MSSNRQEQESNAGASSHQQGTSIPATHAPGPQHFPSLGQGPNAFVPAPGTHGLPARPPPPLPPQPKGKDKAEILPSEAVTLAGAIPSHPSQLSSESTAHSPFGPGGGYYDNNPHPDSQASSDQPGGIPARMEAKEMTVKRLPMEEEEKK